MKFQQALSIGSLAAVTSAHTIFTNVVAGGTTYPVSYALRDPSYDGPIQDVTTNYVACNGGPNPITASSNIINVKAGDTVQAVWRHTLTSDATDVIDPSHKGPVMAYMKKVTDATTDVGYGAGWFKISEAGLNVATQTWAVTDLIANQGLQSITIPSCLANGQYLLRAELIALHAAGSSGGAQLYMECAQINVTGGTGTATPSTVSFPGAYSASDPGILINIYQTLTSYAIPGPTHFTCAAGSGPVASSSVSSKPAATPTTLATSAKVSSTISSAKTTATPTAQAPLYGQCGGSGWTGATICASGTCKVSNPSYSQCLL
ncbi:putative endo-beta-1,4-glucanase D [Lachnellula suecica]|uniref:AA9 family lytic polysaccharide monooxygenase n=1 Tax=Lachnellula suecica TaxID=602035 RepID=A0A8T9C0Y0_9HELO|nr:putative endo-beta-1,4-glucanase D [Lachnellula suecica]